jgi:hypothetical protein
MSPVQFCDPLSREILCFYANHTPNAQIVRITNIADWQFERIVFPGKSILFQALPEGLVELHTLIEIRGIRSDQIPCKDLQVSDELITSLLSRLS